MKRLAASLGILGALSLACAEGDEQGEAPDPGAGGAATGDATDGGEGAREGGGGGGGEVGVPGKEPAHRLQALVATSGQGVRRLLDGNPSSGWRPDGVGIDEGVLLRLEAPQDVVQVVLTGCGGDDRWSIYVDGSHRGTVKLSGSEPRNVDVSQGEPAPVRSVFLKSHAPTPCLAEVGLRSDSAGALDLGAPRQVSGRVRASRTLDPEPAYSAAYLFDQRTDFGWVEGAEGLGLGERVELSLEEPVRLTGLEVWNGYQRSPDHFSKNARLSGLSVAVDGGPPVELVVADVPGAQTLGLAGLEGRNFTFTVTGAVPGSRYEDLVISELRLWDQRGPLTVSLDAAEARATALRAQVRGSSLEGVLDQAWVGVCDGDGGRSLKLRSDHSFVRYEEDIAGSASEVFDGTFVVTRADALWSEVRFFGRRHRTSEVWNPYGDDTAEQTVKIAGGTAKVAKLSELSPAVFRRMVSGSKAIPAVHACLGDKELDELVGRGAIVVEGAAVTDVLVPAGR